MRVIHILFLLCLNKHYRVFSTWQGYYPSIFDDDNFSDRLDENKGGGALLAYGASTVVFSDSAVFK